MKIVFFDEFTLGVLKGDAVVDVARVVQDIPHLGPHDIIRGVIERWAEVRPKLVAADEIADPHQRQIRLSVNGTVKQNFNTNDMAHKIPRCIEWVTSIHTLEPGDVLATGTNHRGLSAFQDGDRIEVETEGLGRL